jgi:hypothetical protein
MSLADSKHPVWYPYYGSWLLALILEIVLFSLSLTICRPLNHFGYTLLGIQISRLLAFILLAALHGGTPVSEEHTPLLINTGQPNGHVGLSNATYGSTAVEKSSSDGADLEFEAEDRKKEEERLKDIEKRLTANGNWFTYACEFSIFLPYVWPSKSKDRKLQFNFLGVMLCLACARALNVLIPYQLGVMINALGASQDRIPLMAIGLYIAFLTASSNVGIPLIKSWLWLPVEQYAYKSIKTASYNHIMGLSCDFHDDKQSGELYKSIEQGSSVNGLLETILFQALPALVDLVVACAYLYYLFGPYMILTVAAMTIVFLWAATYYSAEQSEYQRRNTGIARKEAQIMYDTVGSWTTVAYFNRSAYERGRYTTVIEQHMQSQRKTYVIYYLTWAAQSVVMSIGLFGACLIAAYQVKSGGKSVGDFATLITCWAQFTGKSSTFYIEFIHFAIGISDKLFTDLIRLRPSFVLQPSTPPATR